MRTYRLKIIIFLVLLIILLITVWSKQFLRVWDYLILDNYNHYLSCDLLPTQVQVKKIVRENKREINKMIIEVASNYSDDKVVPVWSDNAVIDKVGYHTSISWYESINCPSKADIMFTYLAHKDRLIYERYLNNMKFHGIPVRLINF